jgi:hypothetical protein
MKTTAQMYQQFLLSSQINYTCTYLSEHFEGLDENSVYRFLSGNKLTARMVWEKAQETLILAPNGYILFDDTVLDKNFSQAISGVRSQYSGNEKKVIKGIGLVGCVYYNADIDRYWVIDFRLFDPERDGKTKLDHMQEMLSMLSYREVPYRTVLMDTWYATTEMMLRIADLHKVYYCPIKANRQVDESNGAQPYQAAERLEWSRDELLHGKVVKLKTFPGNTKVKLFRVILSTEKTELVVTNDPSCESTEHAQHESAIRWHIEQFHREIKQVTGIEDCQCRTNRSQRNHICCSLRVWLCLQATAFRTKQTVYAVKQGLLSAYMRQQLHTPSLAFC